MRLENERKWEEEHRKKAEAIAKQKAEAKAYAAQEKNAESEYRILREKWRDVDLDRVTNFEFHENKLFNQDENGKWVMSWTERLEIFKKDGIAVWEAEIRAPEPMPEARQTEEKINSHADDYDSPSPF